MEPFVEEALRVAVLADDPLARAGLAALLGNMAGFRVVAQDGSGLLFDAAAELFDIAVDLVVWDAGWEPAAADPDDGRELPPGLPVLALVANRDGAADVWRLGCRAVLLRDADEEQLAAALVAVAAGLLVLAPALAGALDKPADGPDPAAAELTPREMDVLRLLAEGMTNKAIAQRLAISDHTVKFHVNAILTKLDAQSRTDAVVRATRLGLIAL